MAEDQYDAYANQFDSEINIRIRELEDRQRTTKDRLVLIGQNLLETKEKMNKEFLEIKKELEIMKRGFDKMMSFLESATSEFENFARKEDLEILIKQTKMLQSINSSGKKHLKE